MQLERAFNQTLSPESYSGHSLRVWTLVKGDTVWTLAKGVSNSGRFDSGHSSVDLTLDTH